MKKQSFLFILLISCITTISIAQIKTQKKAVNKKPMLEIDRLYEKYKNIKTITLFTTEGNFEGNVSIEFNESKKPISVIIEGKTENSTALTEFLIKTIKMKLKQYNQTEPNDIYDLQYLAKGISQKYSKGDMYFKVDVNMNSYTLKDNDGFRACNMFIWRIETGNSRRKITENVKPFVF